MRTRRPSRPASHPIPEAALSRRRFLELGLGAGSALALGCAGLLASEDGPAPPPGACDAHVHLWSANQKKFPRAARYEGMLLKPRRYEPRDFLALAAQNRVDHAVAVQAPCYEQDHAYLLSVLEAHPGRFAGVGSLDGATEPAARLRELKDMGLRGGRLSVRGAAERWTGRETAEALFEAAGELAMPLCLLTEPEFFEPISELCASHPRANVVLDHAGRLAPGVQTTNRERDLEALLALSQHRNVHVKISGFHMLGRPGKYARDVLPLLYRACETFGADRLLWGSDAPQQLRHDHRYALALQLVRDGATDLSEDDRDQIVRRTALRLFLPEALEGPA